MLHFATRLFLVIVLASALSAVPSASRAAASAGYAVEIADVGKSSDLAALLKERGYSTVIPPKNMWVADQQSNCAVWIGKNVPLEMLRAVLPEAMRFNPYLKFFYVVGDRGEKPPQAVENTIHVGGSIEAALEKKLNVIDQQEMLAQLGKAASLEELHRYLHEKNRPKPEQKPAS
ncbi:hypothetical protein M1B72_12500 [Geomonas paludis]|uniref:Uncharacterized protein n=1 Tax=Geomonas paludis TaxID=2740185 RepID=A0A6V8MW30_9BACT|nr:hypothetical protein [Geomonas paludis]UPU34269.1 hypothetical protein M1B72_12500 [Geomonas paludis]GFO64251.1 hypothetical protein GMPD_21700 [Geomonas paludis]